MQHRDEGTQRYERCSRYKLTALKLNELSVLSSHKHTNMYFACFLLIGFVVSHTHAAVTFDISNKEPGPIWVGIQGNSGQQNLNNGGFVLQQGETKTLSAPDNWAGRFWPRTWCDAGTQHCQTGDCGNKIECQGAGGVPPVTLIEITLKGYQGLDYYDVSLVDGFNLKGFIEPVNGQGTNQEYSCTRVACLGNINEKCPDELKVNYAGQTIACNSACNKFNTDQYCCRGAYDRPETCRSSDWPKNYPQFFKDQCPQAYSYAYDDKKSTFTCKANHYRIQFGASF
ncbi:hypothetical protein D910_07406 [Dendroctonus ponderosae]|uniref:Thaumatin-like protein n=1 Tax=Dendroctonus ponderosae TaxID=77166 RepID=U4UCL1_DENPD|nr:hypothetical protein D910_07406 [Dendroctonus ponderosae]